MNVVVQPGQTIFDLAIQHYGDLAGVRYLLEDNVFDGEMLVGNIADVEGLTVYIRDGVVINQKVVDYHKSKTIVTY
jgi:hypothetical protein